MQNVLSCDSLRKVRAVLALGAIVPISLEAAFAQSALDAAERQRLDMQARVRGSHLGSQAGGCDLNRKVLENTYQTCSPKGCSKTQTFLEILGNKVLVQTSQTTPNSGVVYELGRTVDVSAAMAASLTAAAKTYSVEYATASFNGRELVLLNTRKVYSKGVKGLADNFLIAISMSAERIRIADCRVCEVTESSVTLQTFNQPLHKAVFQVSGQNCHLEAMQ